VPRHPQSKSRRVPGPSSSCITIKRLAVVLSELVDGADIGVFPAPTQLAALRPANRFKACGSRASSSGRNFEGDQASKLQIFGLVHQSHTPRPPRS